MNHENKLSFCSSTTNKKGEMLMTQTELKILTAPKKNNIFLRVQGKSVKPVVRYGGTKRVHIFSEEQIFLENIRRLKKLTTFN
jgi:hypothetical protein